MNDNKTTPDIPAHPLRLHLGATRIDCGREPSIDDYRGIPLPDSYLVVDFSRNQPSSDQQELNAWLLQQAIQGASILHIGAGNSSVARLLASRARWITSVTVSENEKQVADSLALANYSCTLINKYSTSFVHSLEAAPYDFILDNNLASFVCCQRHFETYMRSLVSLMTQDGILATHWLGMQWICEADAFRVDATWRLDPHTLGIIADAFYLTAERHGDIFLLKRRKTTAI